MKCGEFDKRNKDYLENYSKEDYFRRLILDKKMSANNNHNKILKGEGLCIFDVGAHEGESALFFNKLFPLSSIYSFEPIPNLADKISRLKLENNNVLQVALSNQSGSSKFYLQDISHLSSLHRVNKESQDSLGYSIKEKHSAINVETQRGDFFVKKYSISTIDLLKIDVQANEVQTLEGFSESISKVRNILVEVSFYDFYENKSSLRLIEEQLPNFELYDIFEVSKNPKTLGTDWASIVYRNLKFIDR